jgi:hypothetical protein
VLDREDEPPPGVPDCTEVSGKKGGGGRKWREGRGRGREGVERGKGRGKEVSKVLMDLLNSTPCLSYAEGLIGRTNPLRGCQIALK